MKFLDISLGSELNELKRFESLKQEERKIVFYSENKNSVFIFESLINELVNLESMLLNIKTSTNIDLIIEGDNPKLELLEINQSFIPLNSDFQEIKQFSLFPNNIETSFDDKSAIFKIKGIKKTTWI